MHIVKVECQYVLLKKWLKSNAKREFSDSDFDQEYKNYIKYLSWQLIENKIWD